MKLKVKDLEIKHIMDQNKEGWALFHPKNGQPFKHRGGWPTQEGLVCWSEVVHVLDPYEKGKTPHHTTFLLKKESVKSIFGAHVYSYREL